jgi:hypothetical protein
MSMPKLLYVWTAGLCILSACDSGTTPPDGLDPTDGFVVSGTIQNNSSGPIPLNARLVAVWVVSAGPQDYTYVFGEGTINRTAGTFEMELSGPPPAAALNDGALGVGILVLTTSASLADGDDIADIPENEVIGAAGWYGIIHVSDAMAATMPSWVADFDPGYGVGEGQDEATGFDSFVPADPADVVLILDAIANIEFVNWT